MEQDKGKAERMEDNSVFIGKRPVMSYVMACMVILSKGKCCTIKARGKSISHAVDVAEILTKKFAPTSHYGDIRLNTEKMTNSRGQISNVSCMEIEVEPQ